MLIQKKNKKLSESFKVNRSGIDASWAKSSCCQQPVYCGRINTGRKKNSAKKTTNRNKTFENVHEHLENRSMNYILLPYDQRSIKQPIKTEVMKPQSNKKLSFYLTESDNDAKETINDHSDKYQNLRN